VIVWVYYKWVVFVLGILQMSGACLGILQMSGDCLGILQISGACLGILQMSCTCPLFCIIPKTSITNL
jgi:hypothetical protein